MKKHSIDKSYRVLGLESSCDDTAASVIKITNFIFKHNLDP